MRSFICVLATLWLVPIGTALAASPDVERARQLYLEGKILGAEEILIGQLEQPDNCEALRLLKTLYRSQSTVRPKPEVVDRINRGLVTAGCGDAEAVEIYRSRVQSRIESTDPRMAYTAAMHFLLAEDAEALALIDKPSPAGDFAAAAGLAKAIASNDSKLITLASTRTERAIAFLVTKDWRGLAGTEILRNWVASEPPDEFDRTLLLCLARDHQGEALGKAHRSMLEDPMRAEELLRQSGASVRKRLSVAMRAVVKYPVAATPQIEQLMADMERAADEDAAGLVDALTAERSQILRAAIPKLAPRFAALRERALKEKLLLDSMPTPKGLTLGEATAAALTLQHRVKNEPLSTTASSTLTARLEELQSLIKTLRIEEEARRKEEAAKQAAQAKAEAERRKWEEAAQALRRSRQEAEERRRLEAERARAAEQARAIVQARLVEEQRKDVRPYLKLKVNAVMPKGESTHLSVSFENTSLLHVSGSEFRIRFTTQFGEFVTEAKVESADLNPNSKKSTIVEILDQRLNKAARTKAKLDFDARCLRARVGEDVHD